MIKKATSKDLKDILLLIKLNSDTFSESEFPAAKKRIRELLREKGNSIFLLLLSPRKLSAVPDI